MTIIVIAGIVLIVLVLVLIGVLVMPQRLASQQRATGHSAVDRETEAYEQHPPGGNTGGL
jgi:hypothetical protein